LLKILTGSINPSSGSVIIGGRNLKNSILEIRKSIGVCPQNDCLFPELTVREHMEFYARIKGQFSTRDSAAAASHAIAQSLEAVDLLGQSETLSDYLSGGMKRKLSVAIAFSGNSKFVFLDEPTSGMVRSDDIPKQVYLTLSTQDPFSRRFTWDVIRSYRDGRCIILTTHSMVCLTVPIVSPPNTMKRLRMKLMYWVIGLLSWRVAGFVVLVVRCI
jgi:ABC-type multidrug transport system ATPase subunit